MKIRQQAEQEIVRATIEAAIKRGFKLRDVDNGEDEMRAPTADAITVDEAMVKAFECDDAHVFFATESGGRAWLYVVLGNEGWTVISDYTVNLEDAVKDTDKLVEKWEELLS